jgi:hypothetical protein
MSMNFVIGGKLRNQFLVYKAKWDIVKINRNGEYRSKICLHCLFFLAQLLIPHNSVVDSKLLNIAKVLMWNLIFYIVSRKDIDRQKFCKYGWDNLFQKSSIVISNRYRNKLAIDIFRKRESAKK